MASRYETATPIEKILVDLGVDLTSLAFEDSSEQDYLSKLREGLATIEFKSKGDYQKNPEFKEQYRILQEEFLRVRKGGKRPQEKKTKISADSFKRGTASPGEVRQNVRTGVIDPSKLKFSSVEVGPKPKALPTSAIVPYQAPEVEEEGEDEGEEKKKTKKKPKDKNLLAEIAKSVVKIADILKEQYGVKKKSAEFDRKKAEQDKRALQKSKLSKGFEALAKGAQKVIAPVQSLLSRIFGFLFNLLLGKFIMKLLDWIGDPKNREKFFSVVRFLKDNWPKLIALYLVFGNSIGKFIFNLTKTLIGGAVKLTIAIAKLMAAKKIKGARGVARFLGKRGGLIGAGVATALTVGGAMAVTNAVAGGGEEQQTQAYSGGGYVKPAPEMQPLPKKVTQERKEAKEKSGPLGFISGMSGAQKGMALGSMFGPLGMLAGAGIGSLFDNFGKNKEDKVKLSKPSEVTLEVPAESVDGGQVDGPGGIDKVPAMLTDGEFVMSRGAVQKIGVDKLEAMNAAGGGTNKPKVVDNKVYASVGGYVSGTDTGKKGTPDPKKEDKSGGANLMPSMGYRLGQINPMQDLSVMEKVAEKVVDKERRRGQGGRLLGSTTQRAGEGTKIYKDDHLVRSYDKYGRKKEYGKPEGFMRALAGFGDLLTGNLFDFDRRNKKNVGVSKTRIITKDFKGSRDYTDDTTTSKVMSAIGRPDLIEHQDQILKQLPKGTTIQDVIKGNVPGVTPDQLTKILATSDAQEATRKKQDNARRLDLAIRGIGEKDGVSMMAGDMTPALQQAEATANKRHAELMKSTDQKKIAAYDKQHGEGAYSQKLKEKLYKTYGAGASGQTQPSAPKPTGKVVGRENLSPQAQAAIARLESKKGLPPDMQYTRNGKKISAEEFNRVKSGNIIPGGGKPGGFLGGMMEGAKNMLGGMFKPSETETIFRDGNIGTPTAEEQRYIDEDKAGRAKIDAKYKARDEERKKTAAKQSEHDRLFGEYRNIVMNEDHPLHRKVAGDLFTDDEGMKFEDFKKLKQQQSQAKLSPNQPQPKVSAPQPPTPPSNNVQVVKSGGSKGGGESQQSSNGSELPAMNAGNGSKSKFTLLGISF